MARTSFIILFVIIVFVVVYFEDTLTKFVASILSNFVRREGFQNKTDGWVLQDSTALHYENAHGNTPPGVGASPGKIQYEQNAASPPVNPANKRGNPQNINPEFKMQP